MNETKRITPNQATLDILLDSNLTRAQREARVTALFKQVSDAVEGRVECPECGDKGPHEDNGCTGIHLNYCCQKCGAHFGPES